MKYFCYVAGCNGSLLRHKKLSIRTARLIFFEKSKQIGILRYKEKIEFNILAPNICICFLFMNVYLLEYCYYIKMGPQTESI